MIGYAEVYARRAGANLSVDVHLADHWHNLCVQWPGATAPRIDRITATDEALHIWTGTPTTGATLSNRLGIAPLPAGHVDIGRVLVRAGAAFITAGDVTAAWIDARIAEIERDIRGH